MRQRVTATLSDATRLCGSSDAQILAHASRARRALGHLHRDGPLATGALLELGAADAVEHTVLVALAGLGTTVTAITAVIAAIVGRSGTVAWLGFGLGRGRRSGFLEEAAGIAGW